ncbi:MAG: PEP-CTERM sorting domain-containing protein [Acidobacteriota bacterium]
MSTPFLRHAVAGLALTALSLSAQAALTFASTSDASSWKVAVNFSAPDGQASSFQTDRFQDAVSIPWRTTDGTGWLANNASGTNGGIGYWSFFVFRQEFDLTGYDPQSAVLSFQWAADDSGQGFADRGSWVPKFRVNGGAFQSSTWTNGETYGFSNPVSVDSGFLAGKNIIDFYVEGNGVTDGFALKPLSLTANATPPVPEPEVIALSLGGLLAVAAWRRRRPGSAG